jgi:adenosylmethionine-8-amino-7-oxononanoate aminotransferase
MDRAGQLKRDDLKYVWHPFTPMSEYASEEPVVIERGEGPYLFDAEGRKYIDGISSLWVNVHGHNHPAINAAVSIQLGKVAHSTMLGITNAPAVELARMLVEIAPAGLTKVFYSDNGSTAAEAAIKIAYQYHKQRTNRPSEKKLFLKLENAYHGDTVGSVSVGGIPLFHGIYRDLLFETVAIPSPFFYRCAFRSKTPVECRDRCLEQLEKTLKSRRGEIAALIMEPIVQGAAGIIVHPEGFLREARRLTKEHDVLLIADEVATGFGRTGRMFACEHENVSPDIFLVAKGLTGGYLPVAATLATDEIFEAFLGPHEQNRTFFHGHTYTGNPLGCAAAIASIKLFKEERTLEAMQPKMEYMTSRLADLAEHKHVGDVRRKGFMVGIELVRNKAAKRPFPEEIAIGHKVTLEARRRGAIIRPLGPVVVLMPPLAIPQDALEKLLDITIESITMTTEKHA